LSYKIKVLNINWFGRLQQVALPSESTSGRETNYHPAIKTEQLILLLKQTLRRVSTAETFQFDYRLTSIDDNFAGNCV